MTAWKRGKRRDSGENPSAERGGGGLLRQPGQDKNSTPWREEKDFTSMAGGMGWRALARARRMRGRTASWVSGRTVGSSSWEK